MSCHIAERISNSSCAFDSSWPSWVWIWSSWNYWPSQAKCLFHRWQSGAVWLYRHYLFTFQTKVRPSKAHHWLKGMTASIQAANSDGISIVWYGPAYTSDILEWYKVYRALRSNLDSDRMGEEEVDAREVPACFRCALGRPSWIRAFGMTSARRNWGRLEERPTHGERR